MPKNEKNYYSRFSIRPVYGRNPALKMWVKKATIIDDVVGCVLNLSLRIYFPLIFL